RRRRGRSRVSGAALEPFVYRKPEGSPSGPGRQWTNRTGSRRGRSAHANYRENCREIASNRWGRRGIQWPSAPRRPVRTRDPSARPGRECGPRASWLPLLALVLFAPSGCREATPAPPPPDVVVANVVQQDVPIYFEWVGTTDGNINAQIRAR